MAISTYKTFLMYRAIGASVWQKLICIKDFGDLGGEPETIDTTTLCDAVRTSIAGVQELDAIQFTANYTKDAFERIKNLEGTQYEFAVWFGGTGTGDNLVPTGSDGTFTWKGTLTVWVTGGAVNEAVEMTISIMANSEIAFGTSGDTVGGVKLSASSVTVAKNATVALSANTIPSGATVSWTSLDEDVATVSSGTVTGVEAGTTTIIASIVQDGETIYDSCTVVVTAS